MLLLVAGPSGERISELEQKVVSYLNNLRGEHSLYNLQMGTMHFDRPREAAILADPLGISADDGITVALVQLSPRGLPEKTLHRLPGTSVENLASAHRGLLQKWSQLSLQPLPAELAGPALRTPPDKPPELPPSTDEPVGSPERPDSKEIYSFEGIRTVVKALHGDTDALWKDLKGQSFRDDRLDVPVREATLGLTEAALNLLQAHHRGVVYPVKELEAVRVAGRQWRLTEPSLYLPVELRQRVNPILKRLKQVEAIEYQGRAG